MKKLPLGIQTFKEIIQGGYVYVDKTRFIYDLLNGVKCYFLSRPRRFGKSLLLDTIAEVFSGDKELFKGLWIYDSDYAFVKHPVIRLDMSGIANDTPQMAQFVEMLVGAFALTDFGQHIQQAAVSDTAGGTLAAAFVGGKL